MEEGIEMVASAERDDTSAPVMINDNDDDDGRRRQRRIDREQVESLY